jgi:hypothetical protein
MFFRSPTLVQKLRHLNLYGSLSPAKLKCTSVIDAFEFLFDLSVLFKLSEGLFSSSLGTCVLGNASEG